MSGAVAAMRELAERLIAVEAIGITPSQSTPAFAVVDKLRPHLATLIGDVGFQALLSRALMLAKAELPSLRAIQVTAEGGVQGWGEPAALLDQQNIFESSVVLLAQLLGLLVAFIGEGLTQQLLHEIWPKLPPASRP